VKHANANSTEISLTRAADRIVMKIVDDGKGFMPKNAREPAGLGLVSMQERVQMLGGNLIVESSPAGGTTVVATIPYGDGG
jgi:signal transduction histidine kinase